MKKVMAGILTATMVLGLAACGKGSGKESVSDSTYVWVPEYVEVSTEESYVEGLTVVGDRLYYINTTYATEEGDGVTNLCYLDLNKPDAEPIIVVADISQGDFTEEYSEYVSTTFATQDGGIIMISQRTPNLTDDSSIESWERMQREATYAMQKLSEDGTELFRVDITEYIQADQENPYVQCGFSDQEGNLYLSNGSSLMWVFDQEGNHLADVKIEGDSEYSYVNGMGCLTDGRVAIVQDTDSGMKIFVYDKEKKSFSDAYENLPPNCWNTGINPGFEGDALLNSDTALYEYTLETENYEKILKWIDCDINPEYIEFVTALSDGRILAFSRDWNSEVGSLIILEKKEASDVVQKEVITLGGMSIDQSLQSAIVEFNKKNELYRIEVKDYTADIDWSKDDAVTAYDDAITRFNNDILTGNAPDLISVSSGELNIDILAAKGILEDLNIWLEKSSVVKREDLFESVLNAYTKSDILCAIPTNFYVQTLIGRTSEVGEASGWTLDDMIAYANQYPDAQIFPYASKSVVLMYSLLFDMDAYINWETGECNFDTPEFKKVLEFANTYPAESDYTMSEPKMLGNHEALLSATGISEAYDWQLQELMFGEPVTAIGYPSTNSTGVLVSGNNAVCICATSENKEAAWSFIEGLLSEEAQENDTMRWGFPIRIEAYNKAMEEAMQPDYELDENGEIVLDENGDPIEYSSMSYGWEDITFEIYAAKQEDVDHITEVINQIDGVISYDEQWMTIVTEEAEAYFNGQKGVDEVTDIIQSRIKIYVNESR